MDLSPDIIIIYMHIKKYLLVTLSLLVCVLAMAEPISSKKALEIATSYLAKSGASRRAASQMSVQPFQTDCQGNPLMYAVNNGGDGYVIVSGDDRMRQVLGYSNSGKLDIADMPENMRYWLQCLGADMQLLIDAGYQPQAVDSRRAASDVKKEITQMLPCQWNQEEPYNDFCPMDGEDPSMTGCVATAMAQLLYYHKKVRQAQIPEQPLQDTKAYEGDRGISVPALKASEYNIDWDQLIDNYTAQGVTPTKAQKENVAKLMFFCGATVYMDYNSDVSLAWDSNLAPALINYFGFSKATRYVTRSSYTEQQWTDLIYNELKNNRPVLLGASDNTGGHEFVIDGYNGNELFHINWGWGGQSDNYFALSVLNSNENFPIGARESTAGYSIGQGAVINAEFGGTAEAADRMVFISSEIADNRMIVTLANKTGVTNTFDYSFAYKNQKTGVTGVLQGKRQEIGDGISITHSCPLTTPDVSYANSTVIYYPVSRIASTEQWLTVTDLEQRYFKASYDAEGKLTLTCYPTDNITANINVDGDLYVGNEQKVKVAFKNTGDERQLNVYFWIKDDEDYFKKTDSEDLKYEYSAGITALKDATHVEVATFTPTKVGTYYVLITRDAVGREPFENGNSQFTVKADPYTVNGLAFSEFNPKGLQSTDVKNGNIVQEVYAPSISPETFVLVNASDKDIIDAKVTFKVWKKEGDTWTEKPFSEIYKPVTLSSNEKVRCKGWEFVKGTGVYRLELLCNGTVTDTRYINTYEAYTVVDATGRLTPIKYTSGAIAAPADATALIIENMISNNVTVTPNENPNTLYYLGEGMTATGLDDKNVINYNQAATITLQDGTNFCVPYDFTAQSISFKRSFQTGWTTLMVPFEVTTIPEGLSAYEFVTEDGSEVTFKQLSKLSAFEACLVRVDAAKEFTFSATNQKVWSNYMDAATAKNFKFIGVTSKPAYEKAYMLSADGSKFEMSDAPAYQSFRGCFVPTYGASYMPEALTIKGTPTGIKTVQTSGAKTDDGYYNLAGQRVGADYKGIVIHNGKKMLKK